ncbi:MAG: ABC transporter ATP-binding protein [Chloroflexota bacterium]
MTVKLETRGLTITFGGLVAVEDLNLALREGELLGLIGPNGAGKTTVFNLLTGVYKPTRGEILFKGTPIHNLQPHQVVRLGIARTFQNIRLFSSLSVLENVMVGRAVRVEEGIWQAVSLGPVVRRRRAEWVRTAEEMLEFVGLRDVSDEWATALPYGRQRLVEIARALSTGCELLLLDEPSAGMNQSEKRELMALVRRIHDELKKTVLIIEHDMKVVMNLVERVVVLDYGRQIAEGPPEEIQKNPLVIEAYLGGIDETVMEAV